MTQDGTLVIKIEPVDGGIPIEMFGDMLVAHQDVLRIVVKSEDKDASEPTLSVVDVQHGSMIIKTVGDTVQQYLPFAKPVMEKMGTAIQEALTGTVTIEAENTKKVKIPKKVLDKMSAPMIEGVVRSITAFEEGQEANPVYSVENSDVKANLEPEDDSLSIVEPSVELGDEQKVTGHLKEIDWDNNKAKIKTKIDGKDRKVQCLISDDVFMSQEVKGNLFVECTVIPEFNIGDLGERTLKCFQVKKVEILEDD